MCRRIQEELLPRASYRFPFGEAEGLSIPAREVGGDFFNYFPVQSEQAAILVGDVSGKGVAAALLMANLQATLSARLPLEADLVRLAERLDREIDEGTPGALYLTLFVAVVDGVSGLVRYVNAGHNPPVVLRSDGAVESLHPTGRPLGLFAGRRLRRGPDHAPTGRRALPLHRRARGSRRPSGEPFGSPKLEALLVGARGESPTGLLARVEAVAPRLPRRPGGRGRRDHGLVPARISRLLKRDLAALEARTHDLLVVGGGIHGVAIGVGRRAARSRGGPRRGQRLRLRGLVEQPQDHPRRPSLSPEGRPRAPSRIRPRALAPCCVLRPRWSSRSLSWCRPTAMG